MSVSRTTGHAVLRHREDEADSTYGRAGRTRALVVALALVMTAVPFMAASVASGANGTPARSAGFNQGGFPLWYEDASGVRVEPCLDPALTNCLAPLASASYNPALPLAFPGNYPEEFFYSAADAQSTPVADCAVTPGRGVTVHLALEGAFINGNPAPGDQMVFGRIRVRADAGTGLCGNTYYTFRTPYGPVTIQTRSDGTIRGGAAAAATVDIGCFPGPAVPCNFDAAFQAPVLKVGLLRQATGAAPGYLGSTAFAPIVGGQNNFNRFEVVKWPSNVKPAQQGFGVDCTAVGCVTKGSTPNFNVLAKLAGPLSSDVTAVDFGGQGLNSTSAPRAITLTNLGSGPLGLDPTTIDRVTVTGPGAGQFAPATTSCSVQALVSPAAATALARDASCAVNVTFTPTQLGSAAATLEVWPIGSTTPLRVALTGTGIAPTQAPAFTIDPADLNLVIGDVRVTTSSAITNVTITNTGTAPLQVSPAISGLQAAAFSIAANSCPSGFADPGASCIIGITFTPSEAVPYSALLDITTNIAATPVISVALIANGTGGIAAVSTDLLDGFPTWYQDERGVRIGQCADPTNTLCITAPITGPVSFPDNYPDEAFYYLATSDAVQVADPACNAGTGDIFVETGVEAAFLTPTVTDGGQITFGRIRFVGGRKGGLCPNTSYMLTFPYGRSVLTTDATGAIKPSPGTTDVGCGVNPCDFSLALSSPVFAGFLQQTVRPAGWLGNPLAPSTVTGAPYIDPDTGLPANHFTVQRLDTVGTPGHALLGSTELFGVSGRLAGPMVADPSALDFGAVEVGTAAPVMTVTFTNVGITDVTLAPAPLTVEGANAADFLIVGGSCAGSQVLAAGAPCTVDVQFTPSATGARAAALVLHHDGQNDPLAVQLSGIGSALAGQPAISAAPGSVTFTDRHIDTVSESQTITVSNLGGSAPLVVDAPTVTTGQPFELTNNCTVPVDVDLSCTITVRFAPTAAGTFSAAVSVPSNAGTVSVPVSGKAVDSIPAQSSTTTTAGFPSWYQDANGVRVEQCLSTDGNCVLLADPTFNPQNAIVFPTNYPTESFYSIVDSDLVNYPSQVCGDGSSSLGGFALLRIATEATFAGVPADGGQTVFNRVRVKASGLCSNTSYTFIHPYGEFIATADGTGAIAETLDLPNVTGTDPVLSGLLRWDPNVAPAAPAGYLGDATTLHQVVGGPYRLPFETEPVNFFRVTDLDKTVVVGETNRFLVAGRLAGPVVSSLDAKAFGTVEQGANSAVQNFVISNIGSTPVSNFAVGVTGTDSSLFAITSNTCLAATVLATDQNCSVTVQLRTAAATAVGAKAATLTVGHNGLRSPVSVALTGEVIAAAQPVLAVTPTSVAFGSATVGTTSAGTAVTIRNSGNAPMRVGGLTVGGANANQFVFTGSSSTGACPITGVAATQDLGAGAQCTVTVAFRPTSIGAKAASIAVAATNPATGASLTPVNVALTGTGAQGTIGLSATTVNLTGRAGRTSTAKVTLTNTGTAPFSLQGNPALYFAAVAGNGTLTKFAATQTGCNNVAVGRNCSVTISFTPGNGTVGETWAADLYMFSNSSNTVIDPRTNTTVNGVKVRVNGSRAR